MSDAPNANGNRDKADKDQRNKNQDPKMAA